jgi:hypothetical protein
MNYPRVYSSGLWLRFPGKRPIEVAIEPNAEAKATKKHRSEHYYDCLADLSLPSADL